MAIVYSPVRTSELAAVNQLNNPFVTLEPYVGTHSTSSGTELEPASNAANLSNFDPWAVTPNAQGNCSLDINFGVDVTPDAVAFSAHNLGSLGGQFRIQHRVAGEPFVDSQAATYSALDNQTVVARISGETASVWRLLFLGLSGNLSVGNVFIGNELVLPQRIYGGYSPPTQHNIVDMNTDVSEGASYVGSSYTERGAEWSTTIDHVKLSFIRSAEFQDFQRRWNRGFPTYWGWRPTDFGDALYSWRRTGGGVLQPTNSGPKSLQSFSLDARAYVS